MFYFQQNLIFFSLLFPPDIPAKLENFNSAFIFWGIEIFSYLIVYKILHLPQSLIFFNFENKLKVSYL